MNFKWIVNLTELNVSFQMKAKVRQQQSEREADQDTHSIMLKELQQILSTERMKNEELKLLLEEVLVLHITCHLEFGMLSFLNNILCSGSG